MAAVLGRILFWLGVIFALAACLLGVSSLFHPPSAIAVMFFGFAAAIYWSGWKLGNLLMQQTSRGYDARSIFGELSFWLGSTLSGLLFAFGVYQVLMVSPLFTVVNTTVIITSFTFASILLAAGRMSRKFISTMGMPDTNPEPYPSEAFASHAMPKEPRFEGTKALSIVTHVTRKKSLRYWLATITMHLYVTFLATIAGAFWAQDTQSFLIVVGVALLLDGIRHFMSPELTLDVDQIGNELASVQRDFLRGDVGSHEISAGIVRQGMPLLPFAATALIVLLNWTDTGRMALSAFSNSVVAERLLPFFEFMGRHIEQLRALGYESRVPVVTAVYATNLIAGSIVFFNALFAGGYRSLVSAPMKFLAESKKGEHKIGRFMTHPNRMFGVLLFFFILGVVAFLILDVGSKIKVGVYYNIHTSSGYFLFFSLFISTISLAAFVMYEALFRMRLDACGIWQELIDLKLAEEAAPNSHNGI